MLANLKAAAWRMLAGSYYCSGLPHVRHRGRVAILTYHRVVSDDMVRTEHIQPGMYVRAQSFETQMAYLSRRFVVLSLDDLLELWRADRLDDRKSYCVITFDDGWQDNYRYAFPVLRKHGLPATIFLATDFIGTTRWFWPDQLAFMLGGSGWRTGREVRMALATALEEMPEIGEPERGKLRLRCRSKDPIDPDALIEWCKKLRPPVVGQFVDRLSRALHVGLPVWRVLLDWDEVREMAGQGMTFGSHSCSHRIMTQIPLAEAKKELIDSRQAMLLQGVKPVPVFCYPNGNHDQSIKALVRENGYLAALGCGIGLEGRQPEDKFALRRLSLHDDSTASPHLFSLAISGLR